MSYGTASYATERRPGDYYREPVVSVAPTSEPITIEDLKGYLRNGSNLEDELLNNLIKEAREEVEHDALLAIMPQTLVLSLDCWPEWEPNQIELRRYPVVAVSSIAYLDSSGVSQTLSSTLYRVDITTKPARITPAYGQTWPVTYSVTSPITITFTAGFATPNLIPETVKQAIRVKAATTFEDPTGMQSEGAEKTYWRLIDKLLKFGVA